jgi:hypothetical protein
MSPWSGPGVSVRLSIQCENVEWHTDLDEPSVGGGGFEG